MKYIRNISRLILKGIAALLMIALFGVFATSVSPIYDFRDAEPFHGPDIFLGNIDIVNRANIVIVPPAN